MIMQRSKALFVLLLVYRYLTSPNIQDSKSYCLTVHSF